MVETGPRLNLLITRNIYTSSAVAKSKKSFDAVHGRPDELQAAADRVR
jgi:hypothetical protein